MKKLLPLTALFPLTAQAVPLTLAAHVERVASYLEGTLDSSAHSREDSEYLDVTVRHCRVRPEEDASTDPGAVYLYVEQALSQKRNAPYRMRFMKVDQNPYQGTVTSTVFENALAPTLKGICDKPFEERIVPAAAFVDGKCVVSLRPLGDAYVGSTPRGGCPSKHNGAVAVSSKVYLGRDFMHSWDQGWGADGAQVWGAVKGPYRFKRVASDTPEP